MIKARLMARLDRLAELFGFERRLECPECHEWFPMWGPTGLFVHLFRGSE